MVGPPAGPVVNVMDGHLKDEPEKNSAFAGVTVGPAALTPAPPPGWRRTAVDAARHEFDNQVRQRAGNAERGPMTSKNGQIGRQIGRGLWLVTAAVAALSPARARRRRPTAAGDVHQRRRPDLPGEVRSLPSARFDRADVAASPTRTRGPWARSISTRVESRQMPPWNIDKTVGIQEFKNDRSLTRRADRDDRQVDRRRRAEGRSEGHAGGRAVARRAGLELRRAVRADRARSDHPSTPWTQKAGATTPGGKPGGRHRPHRTALGARDRNPSRHGEGPQDHPSRHRHAAAGRERSRWRRR